MQTKHPEKAHLLHLAHTILDQLPHPYLPSTLNREDLHISQCSKVTLTTKPVPFPFWATPVKVTVQVLPSLWPLASGAIDPGAFPHGPEETPVSETCEQRHFVFLRLL